MAERLEDDALWRFLDIHLQTEGRVPSLGFHRRVDDIPMLVDVRKPMGLRPGPVLWRCWSFIGITMMINNLHKLGYIHIYIYISIYIYGVCMYIYPVSHPATMWFHTILDVLFTGTNWFGVPRTHSLTTICSRPGNYPLRSSLNTKAGLWGWTCLGKNQVINTYTPCWGRQCMNTSIHIYIYMHMYVCIHV